MGKERPPSWHPLGVLERLRQGISIADQIRDCDEELEALGVDEGGRPKSQTYRNDLYEWRRDKKFDVKYQVAMRECASVRGELRIMGGARPVEFTPEKKQELLDEMASNGGELRAACDVVGVSMGHVIRTINDRSARYDHEFAEAFFLVEGERLGDVYEAMMEEALTKRDKNEKARNPLILSRVAESRLSHLFSPRRQLDVDVRAHHTHELLPAGVTKQLAQQTRAFRTAEITGGVDEGDVIDAEAVLLPEKAATG